MFHAGAFHQLSRNLGLHGHEPGILYELHQLDDRLLTHYLSLYMNGGQGGRAYGGIGNIVKANQGYVIGNFVPLFLQSLHGAQGNGVVFRKKAGGKHRVLIQYSEKIVMGTQHGGFYTKLIFRVKLKIQFFYII